MPKTSVKYVCQSCGHISVRWMGRCPSCGKWNTFLEEVVEKKAGGGHRLSEPSEVKPILEWGEENRDRQDTGFKNLDLALGGGLVPGQVVLIAGEPGIGKSTLLLQVSDRFSGKVLYVSGEESGTQIAVRGKRLGVGRGSVLVYPETNLERIEEAINREKPELLILDSVQTIYSERLESSSGSVSQVREVAFRVTELCKQMGVPVFIVGQITKEGSIAGPKVLEHIVDTVLQFEGERYNFYRVVKVVKNRFGSTGEVAVFKMGDGGLEEIEEPSAFFVAERNASPGSVVFPHTEGSKPILLEVQSLVIPALYTTPQRKTQGFDVNRLSLILAVLEKEANIFTRDADVFVNIAGGISVREPAIDLAVAVAIASSKMDREIPEDTVVFGELGLGGEVRSVHFGEIRLKEAKRFGFKRALVPKGSELELEGMEVMPVSSVKEVVDLVF